eukprot:scaffold201158_cov66-Attheya_sp.AAC.1
MIGFISSISCAFFHPSRQGESQEEIVLIRVYHTVDPVHMWPTKRFCGSFVGLIGEDGYGGSVKDGYLVTQKASHGIPSLVRPPNVGAIVHLKLEYRQPLDMPPTVLLEFKCFAMVLE